MRIHLLWYIYTDRVFSPTEIKSKSENQKKTSCLAENCVEIFIPIFSTKQWQYTGQASVELRAWIVLYILLISLGCKVNESSVPHLLHLHNVTQYSLNSTEITTFKSQLNGKCSAVGTWFAEASSVFLALIVTFSLPVLWLPRLCSELASLPVQTNRTLIYLNTPYWCQHEGYRVKHCSH